jgi:hypothetical protein
VDIDELKITVPKQNKCYIAAGTKLIREISLNTKRLMFIA